MEPNQTPIQPQTPVQPASQPAQPTSKPISKPKKSLPKWPLIIAGVILLATLLTGGYVLSKNLNVNQKSSSKTVQAPSSTATPTPDETANWKTYTNTQYGYSIQYPTTWTINTGADQSTVIFSPPGADAIIKTKVNMPGFGIAPSINIVLSNDSFSPPDSSSSSYLNIEKYSINNVVGYFFQERSIPFGTYNYYLPISNGKTLKITGVSLPKDILDYYNINYKLNAQNTTKKELVAMVHTLQLTTKLQPNTTTWKTYINTKYKYSIKYPSNFEGSDKTGNAISNDFGAPSEGSSFPSLYISVIPDPSKNVPTSSIYNYLLPSFIDSFSSLAPGEIKPEQSGTGNYQEYFTFKKLMDTVTNNQSATTIENNKVWEGDQGLIDRRVFIKKGSDYYQLGAYYKTSEELANFETFLDSFKFTQ